MLRLSVYIFSTASLEKTRITNQVNWNFKKSLSVVYFYKNSSISRHLLKDTFQFDSKHRTLLKTLTMLRVGTYIFWTPSHDMTKITNQVNWNKISLVYCIFNRSSCKSWHPLPDTVHYNSWHRAISILLKPSPSLKRLLHVES